ncbi:ornithine carbamoyltransferase [Maribacter sp. 2307UL18-2]|uniref:ornithine carbamoyltransferase n=1 Tax=Maribacter sp. 2307UL18-2 TaxID=3386274 RepID=UPI0039BD1D8D
MKKKRKHVLSLRDLSNQDTLDIINSGVDYARGKIELGEQLKGKVIGIYFTKTSTRTRTSFSSAALRLGAQIISYGPNDLQINTGENIHDTLQVLSQMLDGLVVRTSGPLTELRTLKNMESMSLINAMTDDEHPTQALADLTTIKLHFGELSGIRIIYFGEGNNTAIALALSLTKFRNVTVYFCTPPNYGLDKSVLCYAQKEGKKMNSHIQEVHRVKSLPLDVDIIYTTRWETTGTIKDDINWRKEFEPFSVTERLMAQYPKAIFMHDLPAHRGEEVEASVIDGEKSIVFEQAKNKVHSAKAVLQWCLG